MKHAVVALFFLVACKSSGSDLRIDLKTDIVSGEEFSLLQIVITDDQGREVARGERTIEFGRDFVDGERALDVEGLANGSYRARAILIDAIGLHVARRTTLVQVDGDTGITVLISRDSRTCNPATCNANQTCGVSALCISEECSPETDAMCPPDACTVNTDCGTRADCAIPVCVSGVCLYAAAAGGCADDEWCNPEEGCLPRTGVIGDGGFDAAVDAPVDAFDAGSGCPVGMDDCDGDGTCELDVSSDIRNCGGCGVRCDAAVNGTPSCVDSACEVECDPGWDDCDGDPANGCETDPTLDPTHCRTCGSACPGSLPLCVASDCVANPFPSTGAEGAFAPAADMTLSAGVHHFTTIDIPAGVTVTAGGNGVLDLRATGDVTIAGVIDASGGRGGNGGGDGSGGGGGGETGTGIAGPNVLNNTCPPGAGGGLGAPGMDAAGTCGGAGGRFGGGSGGGDAGGGGGGGAAGGGGSVGDTSNGAAGGSLGGSTGGPSSTTTGRGAEPDMGAYSGGDGTSFGCCRISGGGGGSIGSDAIADLAMSTTFGPGSGGGGSGGFVNISVQGGGSGGGGGGGGVRISSDTRIEITGDIRVRGGDGGDSTSDSAGGGGGSGGAIYLAAPEMNLMGMLDAAGGNGGTGLATGGNGGLGRIRLSVDPDRCTLGLSGFPIVDSTCVETNVAERVYIGAYPN